MRSSLALFVIPLLSACPANDDDDVKRCFVGDPNLPAEIQPIFRDVSNQMQMLEEGAEVPLILPPQGGKVMVVGVRARNLDGCPLEISTSLRDTCTNAIISLERRPVLLNPNGEGWLDPLNPAELENYSNLPACPRANLDRDVHAQPYLLTIRVEDKDGRMAETRLEVVPTCAEPEFMDQCLCECRQDYRLGDECTGERPDAGTSATCDAG